MARVKSATRPRVKLATKSKTKRATTGRKAPRAPASSHRVNSVVRGLDGRSWVVKKREDGAKAWYRHGNAPARISSKGRNAPPYPATGFPLGTHKRGANGCMYTVHKFRKVPRWTMTTGGPKCGKWSPNRRQAPDASATTKAVGTVAKGRNGHKWKVVKNVNGVKSWRQLPKSGASKGRKSKGWSAADVDAVIRSLL
jgi:hypothetical protein